MAEINYNKPLTGIPPCFRPHDCDLYYYDPHNDVSVASVCMYVCNNNDSISTTEQWRNRKLVMIKTNITEIDWVRLNVPPTQYRSYGNGFLHQREREREQEKLTWVTWGLGESSCAYVSTSFHWWSAWPSHKATTQAAACRHEARQTAGRTDSTPLRCSSMALVCTHHWHTHNIEILTT